MFLLNSKDVPENADELARAIEESIRPYVRGAAPLVAVRPRVFPYYDEIRINLDKAELDSKPPPMPTVVGETKFAFEAGIVALSARNVRVQGAPLDLRLEAHRVLFDKGKDANDQAILIVKGVREGHLRISAAQLDLENAIGEIARREARKHGIKVDEVRLALRARGARSLSADVRFQARKFLLSANIDISVQLDVDEDFVAKISNVKCKGEGAIGSLACGALDPHLRQLDGQTFSLMSLPLGELQLRDVRIAVADTVEITADFGTPE
jgi:hypothetical protein